MGLDIKGAGCNWTSSSAYIRSDFMTCTLAQSRAILCGEVQARARKPGPCTVIVRHGNLQTLSLTQTGSVYLNGNPRLGVTYHGRCSHRARFVVGPCKLSVSNAPGGLSIYGNRRRVVARPATYKSMASTAGRIRNSDALHRISRPCCLFLCVVGPGCLDA